MTVGKLLAAFAERLVRRQGLRPVRSAVAMYQRGNICSIPTLRAMVGWLGGVGAKHMHRRWLQVMAATCREVRNLIVRYGDGDD